ncbi:MAG TPA: FliH/SctL family protein [Candidatus Limnocylindrales bacterium]
MATPARPAAASAGADAPLPAAPDEGLTSLAAELGRMRAIAHERGYAEGRARAEGELRVAVAAAGALAARLEQHAPRDTANLAHAIAELGLAVARRIVADAVRQDPAVLVTALEEAIATINGSPEARVMLHPAAVEPVRVAWEAAHGRAHLGKRWVFEPDASLPSGGCVVRYDHGFVDAGLETQLEEIGIALDRAIPGFVRERGEEEVA